LSFDPAQCLALWRRYYGCQYPDSNPTPRKGEPNVSHLPHELPEAFPDKIAMMQELRSSEAHFARLSDLYHSINREIHQADTNIKPVSDVYLEDMKKRRLVLLDEIAGIVNRA
jgi:uncharacterized protein YdcH (DUF465 family)